MQLLDDLKGKWGYWKLKEEALDLTLWRIGFGRGCGPVVRRTTEWMRRKEDSTEWSDRIEVCGVRSEPGDFRPQCPKRLNEKDGRHSLHFSMCIYLSRYVYTRGYNAPLSNKITFTWQISPCVSITKFYLNHLYVSQHVTNTARVTHTTLHSTLYYLALLALLSVTATGALLFPLSWAATGVV